MESRPQSDIFQKCYEFTRADIAKKEGWYPYFVPLQASDGTEVTIKGKKLIMLGSNNYLGLTHDPRIIEQAEAVARVYGTGCTGSRFLNGNLDLHEKLERELADFVGMEAALVFSTGFQTNQGILTTIVGRDDTAILDKLDHASIVDGVRLSEGESIRFRHNDVADMESALRKAEARDGGKMVVVDGVFSMEGDLANLPELIPVAKRYGAAFMVDEAHSVGMLGPTGAGAAEHFGMTDQVDIIMATFSKSFGSLGGFAAGKAGVISYIKHHARSLIFSASMPPYAVATVRAALEIIKNEPERREKMWRNAKRLIDGLKSLGFDIGPTETPIIPIIIGDTMKTILFWKALFEAGVYTNPVIAPAVPEKTARLRTSVMATHTDEQMDRVLEICGKVGKKMGLI
ncbi:MAG: aminotransferase class I/II-fold pyridoxal phosphate-dependent enzyme [Candidatus Eisenbacteria bacterium]|uniref:Aminotransferase class I/II-fold pyridoxal phosphate-dependent enzyme n=1 Tax=Eiseniibacteriota bacterium TaxID=2212470 RepID=A0A948RUY1_UNCEI|nr:aminotransferase class I/II-fold pyridoxal phosphate-dependent enzyme [Candidatus Eisenbacteria bacterium]MBU2690164.1 aminotransferase class I/II-fold pyridoxal phosphate-dependent enzyme [Candidatus Eisenbacteria bacterium]